MFDLIVLAAAAGLTVRGWRRGLMRQVAAFVSFIFSLLLVVRLAPDWALVVEEWLGIPYGAALTLVGLALFSAVGIVVWVALQALTRLMRLPGLNTADRAAGAVVGLGWLVLWVMTLIWFASFLPLPDSLTSMLSESRVVGGITEPDSLPRRALDALTQNSWEEMLIKIAGDHWQSQRPVGRPSGKRSAATLIGARMEEGIVETFFAHRDPSRAEGMSGYMKHRFPFLGISSPERRRLAQIALADMPRPEEQDLAEFARGCWNRPEREYQYAAIDQLRKATKRLSERFLTELRWMIITKPWWDSCDPLSGTVVGGIVRRFPASALGDGRVDIR